MLAMASPALRADLTKHAFPIYALMDRAFTLYWKRLLDAWSSYCPQCRLAPMFIAPQPCGGLTLEVFVLIVSRGYGVRA